MKNLAIGLILVVCCLWVITQGTDVQAKDYYRTYEIIDMTENSLILEDSDYNVIEVDKDPGDYKIGYKVRYDSVRNRLRPYRWQDYTVMAVTGKDITLQHESGDTVTVEGDFSREYKAGDEVRYDDVDNKIEMAEETGRWQQYTVVASSPNQVVIRSNIGEEVILHMNNNRYAPGSRVGLNANNREFVDSRGIYVPLYKVGDKVRYDAKKNKIKKEVRRTYAWTDYTIKEISDQDIVLVDENNQELVIKNTYGSRFKQGDRVKYDYLNQLLKKAR